MQHGLKMMKEDATPLVEGARSHKKEKISLYIARKNCVKAISNTTEAEEERARIIVSYFYHI